MIAIDLNCDLGEVPGNVLDGTDERILARITSANIACGGHAGDNASMEATLRGALRHGVAVGAHPGYLDRERFGRVRMDVPASVVADLVEAQVRALDDVARRLGAVVVHVKPHGALYHAAGADEAIARAVATGAARVRDGLLLVGQAGSPALDVWRRIGFPVAVEAFADRTYEAGGQLRPRSHADALLLDPAQAARQALEIARNQRVVAVNGTVIALRADTICIHGDTPGAPGIAQAVRALLEEHGVRVRAPSVQRG